MWLGKEDVVDENCANCQRILAMTRALDREAKHLTRRVHEFCAPVREANNALLEEYARNCQKRFIGWLYRMAPPKLTPEPFFRQQYWFVEKLAEIESKAHLLEGEKQEDQPHWDQERVLMRSAHRETTRLMCYKQGDKPRMDSQYDFTSPEGAQKLVSNRLVICADTQKVVSASDRVLDRSGQYRLKKPMEIRV